MRLSAAVALLCLALPTASPAEERATTKEAELMVHKAVAFYKEQGREKALATFQDKKGVFTYRDLFVYAMSVDGVMLAHPFLPQLVGKPQLGFRDADGKLLGKGIVDLARTSGKGWIEYRLKNPANGKDEPKAAYVEAHDGVIFVCGAYRAG